MTRFRQIGLWLGLALCATGCTSEKPAPPQTGPKGGLKRLITSPGSMNDVRQIGQLYLAYEATFNKPPSKPEDLKDDLVKAGAGKIYHAIEDGTYVVVWNIRNPSSQNVVAYEKDADDKGLRWVAMGDGSVKKMNQAEFKQALGQK